MRIAVLMGGDSPERDVSLATGRAIADGLERRGHQVQHEVLPDVRAILDLDPADLDVVIPALHGGDGEDGHLQALLDVIGVPYVFSGQLASALAMDKAATKRVMTGADIPTPDWLLVAWDRATSGPVAVAGPPARKRPATVDPTNLSLSHIRERAEIELGFPLVVKLNSGGSSVGVEIVDEVGDFEAAFARVAAAESGPQADLLLERYVAGRELTAAVLLGRRLPLLEIRPASGFYDYRNKYTSGASEYLVPAPVHSPHYERMCADALRLYDLLGCRSVARVDFRFDGQQHWCLEVNTIPGMTELSLVPMAAQAVGISFDDLVEDLCRDAMLHAGSRT